MSNPVFQNPLSWRAARLLAFVFRFRGLALAARVFRDVPAGTWARRRLFGFTLALDLHRSRAQQLLYLHGERTMEEKSLLLRHLRPGMTAVDVGANIGYYLLLFQKAVGPSGRVVCIEPSRENLPELRLNIALNHFRNVDLHELAVGDVEAVLGVRSGINGGMVSDGQGAHTVRVVPLDSLVGDRVDFLKIDVDGFEDKVLRGSLGVIRRHRPVLLLEVHPHLLGPAGVTCRSIHDFLAEHYGMIEAFDLPRPERMGLWEKLLARYGRGGLRRWNDPGEIAREADLGRHPHTYWLVCRGDPARGDA